MTPISKHMLDLALNPAHRREVLLLLPFWRAYTNREIGFVLARNGVSRGDDRFRGRFGDQHFGQLTLRSSSVPGVVSRPIISERRFRRVPDRQSTRLHSSP